MTWKPSREGGLARLIPLRFPWHPPTLPSHPPLYPAPLLHPPSSCSCPLSDPPTVRSAQSGTAQLYRHRFCKFLVILTSICRMSDDADSGIGTIHWNNKRDTIHNERVLVGLQIRYSCSSRKLAEEHCAPVFFCLHPCLPSPRSCDALAMALR